MDSKSTQSSFWPKQCHIMAVLRQPNEWSPDGAGTSGRAESPSHESSPPQMDYRRLTGNSCRYMKFENGALDFVDENGVSASGKIDIPETLSIQFIRLDKDGHLRVYEWRNSANWTMVKDLFELDYCLTHCMWSISSVLCSNGHCYCPGDGGSASKYFVPISPRQPNMGCSRIIPLSCSNLQEQMFLQLDDVSSFSFVDVGTAAPGYADEESSKQACLNNYSCVAALFGQPVSAHTEDVLPESELFTLNAGATDIGNKAFVTVQNLSTSGNPTHSRANKTASNGRGIMSGGIQGSVSDHWCVHNGFDAEKRQGGFGSVYKGVLEDGKAVAVKQLDGISSRGNTSGSSHHTNLVKLIGFCAEKSHRLLVYDYMENGSLEIWIFAESSKIALDWKTRKNIVLDIANGLAYLHEKCSQRIAHLDIKLQNILLNNKFNAKVSDFGLSKLIDKEQSQVMTTVRGTLGYLAPEWFTSMIVDVYRFGVVVLEIAWDTIFSVC